MKSKTLNIIGMVAAILGGLVILGAVGAVDCGTFTMGRALAQIAVGALVIGGGLVCVAAARE